MKTPLRWPEIFGFTFSSSVRSGGAALLCGGVVPFCGCAELFWGAAAFVWLRAAGVSSTVNKTMSAASVNPDRLMLSRMKAQGNAKPAKRAKDDSPRRKPGE
jgi:hypothetical protein